MRSKNEIFSGKNPTLFFYTVFYYGYYVGWPHSTKSHQNYLLQIIIWRMETACCINVVGIWGRIHHQHQMIGLFSLTQQVCSWQQQIVGKADTIRAGLASSWTLKSWRNGLTGLSCSLALTNAKPWPWKDIIPANSTGWALTGGGAALLLEEAADPGGQRAEPKPVAVVRKANHILGCISKNVVRRLGVEGSDYFPVASTGEAASGVLCAIWGIPAQERGQ